MKLFVQTLEGDARDWFCFLPARFISSWSELHSTFMEQFGEWVSMFDSYDKFFKIHIGSDELVPQLNIRFARSLNDIPESYRPNDQMCLAIYFGAFDSKMSFLLRDKEPQALYQAFLTARNIENNLKHGLMRSYLFMNDCRYNGHERNMEHGIDVSVSNQNVHPCYRF